MAFNNAQVNLLIGANSSVAIAAIDKVEQRFQQLSKSAAKEASSVAERWDNLSFGKKVSIGFGAAQQGIELGASLADRAGFHDVSKALSQAGKSSRELATMLSPLGPIATTAGAAIGGVVGAIRGLVDASTEAAKKAAIAAQKLRDSSAKVAIEERRAVTPEDKARRQHEARERMSDYRIKLERDATISEDEVLDAARWNRGLAKKMMTRTREQNGGVLPDKLQALDNLYSTDEFWLRRYAGLEDGYEPNLSPRLIREYANSYAALQRDKEALGPEIVATTRSKSGKAFDKELDALYAEMTAPKEKPKMPTTTDAEKRATAKSKGGELSAKVDSWSAMGIGYTGNPMMKTETLLAEVSRNIANLLDVTRRNGRTPVPAIAV